MRPLLLALFLGGCAASSAEMINSPAGHCVSDMDPARQCCGGSASGVELRSASWPACPTSALPVINRAGPSTPLADELSR